MESAIGVSQITGKTTEKYAKMPETASELPFPRRSV
jgi:hypothetical protein